MKRIAFSFIALLAGCAGAINANDVLSQGVTTEPAYSTKSARQMVACITPFYEAKKSGSVPIALRITADGYELIENTGMANAYVMSIITVSEDGAGSVTVGYLADGIAWADTQKRRIVSIIAECP